MNEPHNNSLVSSNNHPFSIITMSTSKRNKSSIMRLNDEEDHVRVEMQGFYWPRLLVKQKNHENKQSTVKIPRRLNKDDKKSKALLLRQLIKNSKMSSSPSRSTAQPLLPPMLPSLDRSLRESLGVDESFRSYATLSIISTASSWNPTSSTRSVTNTSSRITGNLWPHRVPVVLDEQHFGSNKLTAKTTFSTLRPSSPTSIMGRNHHHHHLTPSRPRAVTLDAH